MPSSLQIRMRDFILRWNAAGHALGRMLLKISAPSCCAARYIDAHSSRAQSESGKRGTRGRGFHKGAEKSGAQSNVSVVKKERDHESAEKENRSRPGGGWRRHRK